MGLLFSSWHSMESEAYNNSLIRISVYYCISHIPRTICTMTFLFFRLFLVGSLSCVCMYVCITHFDIRPVHNHCNARMGTSTSINFHAIAMLPPLMVFLPVARFSASVYTSVDEQFTECFLSLRSIFCELISETSPANPTHNHEKSFAIIHETEPPIESDNSSSSG